MQLLHGVAVTFESARDGRLQGSPLGQGLESEHLQVIFAESRTGLLEIRRGADAWQKLALQLGGPRGQIGSDRLIVRKLLSGSSAARSLAASSRVRLKCKDDLL